MRPGSADEGGKRPSPFFASSSSFQQRTAQSRPTTTPSTSTPSSSAASALNPFNKKSRYTPLNGDVDEVGGGRNSNPFDEDNNDTNSSNYNTNNSNNNSNSGDNNGRTTTSYNPFVTSQTTRNPFMDSSEEVGSGRQVVGSPPAQPPSSAFLGTIAAPPRTRTSTNNNNATPPPPPPRPPKQFSASSPPPPSHPPPPVTTPPPNQDREIEMTSVSPSQRSDEERVRSERSRNNLRKHFHKIETKFDKHSGEGGSQCCVDKSDENAVIRFLVKKRVFGYPDTDGGLLSNYIQYIYNNHPLLSVFLLNPLNPYGRKERIIVFFNSLFFAIFISFIVVETTYIPKLSTCRLGCDRELVPTNSSSSTIPAPSTANTTMTFSDECVGGYNDGLSYDKYHQICEHYHPWMLSAVSGAFIVLYQSAMEFFATCGCIQGRNFFQNNCIGYRCKSAAEWFGGWMLFFFSSISVVLLIWAVIACYLRGAEYEIFVNIILSKMWSVGEWFIWSAPYFSYRYPLDKRRFLKKVQRRDKKNNPSASSPAPRASPNNAEV